ncbi:hypothetical protein, partial [Actinocorallia lasiicapitis]
MGGFGELPPAARLYRGPVEPEDAAPTGASRKVLLLVGGAIWAAVLAGVALGVAGEEGTRAV